MKTLIFNIVKLLISVVFQYSIFVGTFLYCTLAGIEFYDILDNFYTSIFIR